MIMHDVIDNPTTDHRLRKSCKSRWMDTGDTTQLSAKRALIDMSVRLPHRPRRPRDIEWHPDEVDETVPYPY